MSRATVDLQSVRFFLGYGPIFIMQSALTILLASVAMFAINWWLAAIALLPVLSVIVAAALPGAAPGRPCRRSSSGSPS